MQKVFYIFSYLLSIGILSIFTSQNASATTCITPKVKGYHYVGCLHDGLAGVIKKSDDGTEKVGYINQAGKLIIPTIYEAETEGEGGTFSTTNDFSEGLVAVHKLKPVSGDLTEEKYGYLDTTGKVVIPFNLGFTTGFSEGLATVMGEHGSGAIDKTGKVIIPFQYAALGDFSEGLAVARKGEKVGFIDKNNKTIFPFTYDSAGSFHEGMAAVQKNNHWGYIDKAGKVVIPINLKYNSVGNFSEGLAIVATENKYGYIDKSGKVVIPVKLPMTEMIAVDGFIEENDFHNGKAKVYTENGEYCINTKGTKVSCK